MWKLNIPMGVGEVEVNEEKIMSLRNKLLLDLALSMEEKRFNDAVLGHFIQLVSKEVNAS